MEETPPQAGADLDARAVRLGTPLMSRCLPVATLFFFEAYAVAFCLWPLSGATLVWIPGTSFFPGNGLRRSEAWVTGLVSFDAGCRFNFALHQVPTVRSSLQLHRARAGPF